jgi:hypothetical protein
MWLKAKGARRAVGPPKPCTLILEPYTERIFCGRKVILNKNRINPEKIFIKSIDGG